MTVRVEKADCFNVLERLHWLKYALVLTGCVEFCILKQNTSKIRSDGPQQEEMIISLKNRKP